MGAWAVKEDAYAASGILGKLLCTIGAHRYCNHPRIEGTFFRRLDDGETDATFHCPKCEQEFTFNGEKFVPISEKHCLRCGHVKAK